MDQNNYIFEVEDLCKYFPAGKKKVVKAVDGINLKIRKARRLVLLENLVVERQLAEERLSSCMSRQRERFFLKEKMYPNFMERNCYLSKRMFRSYSRIRMHLWTHV